MSPPPGLDRYLVDCNDTVASNNASLCGGRLRSRCGKYRGRLLGADQIEDGIQHHGQDQVKHGTRRDNRDAPGNRLQVEGLTVLCSGCAGLGGVKHLDVATKRNRRKRPFGAMLIGSPQQHFPETNRKPQHPHATPARNQVMAEFMKCNQDA